MGKSLCYGAIFLLKIRFKKFFKKIKIIVDKIYGFVYIIGNKNYYQ